MIRPLLVILGLFCSLPANAGTITFVVSNDTASYVASNGTPFMDFTPRVQILCSAPPENGCQGTIRPPSGLVVPGPFPNRHIFAFSDPGSDVVSEILDLSFLRFQGGAAAETVVNVDFEIIHDSSTCSICIPLTSTGLAEHVFTLEYAYFFDGLVAADEVRVQIQPREVSTAAPEPSTVLQAVGGAVILAGVGL